STSSCRSPDRLSLWTKRSPAQGRHMWLPQIRWKTNEPRCLCVSSGWDCVIGLKGLPVCCSFAPWCPACQQLQPVWNEFAEWGEDLGVNIAKVDVTEQPGLSGRFIITALPTIYHCKDGAFRRYQGARSKDDFLSFIDEKKWQSIEPVSSWFGPSSFLMNAMSALFKLSMFIRVSVYAY
uniref:Thioredoxin-related transmembrane protein 1 n=1 Tax=Sinocyclocheilus grahami TaxID=75366 RepID=A0A672KA98_SINGR